MSILSNFINLIELQSDLNPYSLTEIRNLVSRITVIKPTQPIHYTLLDKKILRLAEYDSVIYDLNVVGLQECQSVDTHIERLAFRLGKTFNDPRLTIKLDTILSTNYVQFMVDGNLFFKHKESSYSVPEAKDLVHEILGRYGLEFLDRTLINSLFGEIFYWRE